MVNGQMRLFVFHIFLALDAESQLKSASKKINVSKTGMKIEFLLHDMRLFLSRLLEIQMFFYKIPQNPPPCFPLQSAQDDHREERSSIFRWVFFQGHEIAGFLVDIKLDEKNVRFHHLFLGVR